MLVKCLNCGHEFHGKFMRDELGKHCECEKCGCTFDVTEPELEFTLVNCEGKEIRKTYDMVEDFKTEMKSDNIDIPMMDDTVKDMTLWGVKFNNEWDISALLDYLKMQIEKWCEANGIDTNSEQWEENVRDEIGGCDAVLDATEIERLLNENES